MMGGQARQVMIFTAAFSTEDGTHQIPFFSLSLKKQETCDIL
jgi:hypothetical protein